MQVVHGVSDGERQQLWDFLIGLRDRLFEHYRNGTRIYGFNGPGSDWGADCDWVIAIIGRDLLVVWYDEELHINNRDGRQPLRCFTPDLAEKSLWP
jgi:hypothetical protein